MTGVGALRQLNVQPGDVVQCVTSFGAHTVGKLYEILPNGNHISDTGEWKMGDYGSPSATFRIIPRAPDKPKLWKDMTPEEKGALLLAHLEGKFIEFARDDLGWSFTPYPSWCQDTAYRVKTEPKVETVTLFWGLENKTACLSANSNDTHTITFNLIDGIPDCGSVKMGKL